MQPYRRNQDTSAAGSGGNGSGQYNACWIPGGDLVYPGCGKPLKPQCDLDIIGARLEGIAPQTVWGPFTVAPTRSNHAQYLGKRVVVYDDNDPTSLSQLVAQDFTVNREPVYGVSAAAGLGTLTGVSTLLWTSPDGCWCPVPGFIGSQANLVGVYQESGINREPAVGGLTLTYQVEFYVNGLDICPAGYNAKCLRAC